jgi:hypothetical protein
MIVTRKFKKGEVREDGMVFWRYRNDRDGRERWITQEQWVRYQTAEKARRVKKRRGKPRKVVSCRQGRKQRPLRFIELDTGCIVCVSHKGNAKGYVNLRGNGLHRTVWAMHNGPIPEGYEIDHKCENTACCNPDHLQCLSKDDHGIKTTHTQREKDQSNCDAARWFLELTGLHEAELPEAFGVLRTTANRWFKRWKEKVE